MLTITEKVILRNALRREFESLIKYDHETAKEIIKLYEKFELGTDFIEEIKNDFEQFFNLKY